MQFPSSVTSEVKIFDLTELNRATSTHPLDPAAHNNFISKQCCLAKGVSKGDFHTVLQCWQVIHALKQAQHQQDTKNKHLSPCCWWSHLQTQVHLSSACQRLPEVPLQTGFALSKQWFQLASNISFSKIRPHTELTQTLQAPQIPLPAAHRQLPVLTPCWTWGDHHLPDTPHPEGLLQLSPLPKEQGNTLESFLSPQQVQFRLRSYVHVPLGDVIEISSCLRGKKATANTH